MIGGIEHRLPDFAVTWPLMPPGKIVAGVIPYWVIAPTVGKIPRSRVRLRYGVGPPAEWIWRNNHTQTPGSINEARRPLQNER